MAFARSQNYWVDLILEQKNSGMTIADFVKQKKIGLGTFYKKKRKVMNDFPELFESSFKEIKLESPGGFKTVIRSDQDRTVTIKLENCPLEKIHHLIDILQQ